MHRVFAPMLIAAAVLGGTQSEALAQRSAPQRVAANNWFETYLIAHGGCRAFQLSPVALIDARRYAGNLATVNSVSLFGKPLLKWSDDDIGLVLGIYRNCKAQKAIAAGTYERDIPTIIAIARNTVAQAKSQQQAKEDLERRRAAEVENEKQAVEEKRKAEEEKKIAEEEKRKVEQAIKDREAAEAKAARDKREAEQTAAERKHEVESMPLTAADVQVAVKKVEKFVADYKARKVDASNVETRLEEATRAADEASRLIQTVKDHMSRDDNEATLNLENTIMANGPHLDDLRAKIARIPQEIAEEKAGTEKAERLAKEAAEEEADRQRDASEVGERHLAVNTMFENVLYLLNDGEVTVRITDIQINGRSECTESPTLNHAAWFNAANKSDDSEKAHPIILKVGESRRWLSPCRIIFSDITTYQGTARYKSEQSGSE